MTSFYHPLMEENVNREDINSLIAFLQQDPLPQFTNGPQVRLFEKEWGEWQNCPLNTMVGSGSVANEITLLVLKHLYPEGGEILLSPLGWISDAAAVVQAGFKPVFCDINLKNFSIDIEDVKKKVTHKTRALLLVHILGYNGISDDIINFCKENKIYLIEDCCESHGATHKGVKVGNFGDFNNFSYFFAHHMCSLSEGGMIGVKDNELYNLARAYRSHGMLRECPDENFRNKIIAENPELNPSFIFLGTAHNGRSQEVNAVVARNQLKRLDANNEIRSDNFLYFLNNLNPEKYLTTMNTEGNSNYAFTVVLKNPSITGRDKMESTMKKYLIEFRRGLSGGGSLIRQPALKKLGLNPLDFPNTERVHHFSWYIGNYPTLKKSKIDNLLRIFNSANV